MATIFSELIKRETPTPPIEDPLLTAVLAGQKITRETALTLPVVAGAVDLISSTVAAMPVKLYRREGRRVIELEDARARMLNQDTGDTLDAFQLKKAMVVDYLLSGGGYSFIDRERNNVKGLFYVPCEKLSILNNYKPIFKDYTILVQGQEFERWQFIKLLRNTRDGAQGVGLIEEIGKTIETAYATLVFQLRMAKTGGARKGFLTSENHLTQQAMDIIKGAWNRMYTGETETTPFLNKGVKFQEISNTAVESQINETRKTITEEIDNLFHIYPDFLQTFKMAIYPVMKAFETALNRDLILEEEKPSLFFAFDPKETLRVSIKERYEAYKLAKETGFMTLNEIRQAENLDWIKGLDVVNVGLSAVLFNTQTGEFYTPNTDKTRAGNVLAVDFDDTIAGAGEANPRIVERLKTLQNNGIRLILWTTRKGEDLQDAVNQCERLGLVFDEIAEGKPDADFFIDDKNIGLDELEESWKK